MEIFGKSLSDFKKPLLISVAVLAVILIGAFVVLNFVLNLGASVTYEPEAELEYNQFKVSDAGQNGTAVHMVKIEVEDLNRGWDINDKTPSTDYLVVTTYVGDEVRYAPESEVGYATELSTELEKETDAPNRPSQTESIYEPNQEGAIVANEGDVIYVTSVEKGDRIQVFGGIDGFEQEIESYEVK